MDPLLTINPQQRIKQTDGDSISGDDMDGKWGVGIIGIVGKEWPIDNKLSIITESRCSGIPGMGAGMNVGVGIGGNYKF